jgi:putative glutamine amidotransferase
MIGISTYRQPADWSSWKGVRADLLPAAYAESVAAAGGAPVLIPPVASAASAHAVIVRLDGLIISGGADVNPARYGETPDENVSVWYEDRDASELWLLDAAKDVSLPVLGICRGMQLMAVHAGGRLVQHLPDLVGHAMHAGSANGYSHLDVTVKPGHRISGLLGPEVIAACHHHQAVASHPGFVGTARDLDGVVQAMESEGERFELAVQWHPETAEDGRLFAGLVVAAQEFARQRS